MNNPDDLAAQRKKDADRFEQVKAGLVKQLPGHDVLEFSFSGFEQHLLAEQQTIIALATQTQDAIINEICLKRLGITPTPQIHIRYAIGLGKLVVFSPRQNTDQRKTP